MSSNVDINSVFAIYSPTESIFKNKGRWNPGHV